jgi:NADH kinase
MSFSILRYSHCLDIHDFREAIQDIYEGRATVLDRMRLSCTFYDAQGVEFGSCGSVGL